MLGQIGHFTPNFSPSSSISGMDFLKHFAFSVHIIISRQMKYKTYRIFKSFFWFKSPLLYCKQSLICPFDHLPTVAAQSRYMYLICLYISFIFNSDMMRLCNEQTTVTYTYFPKRVPICGKSDILIQFHSISVYFQIFETWNLVYFCVKWIK